MPHPRVSAVLRGGSWMYQGQTKRPRHTPTANVPILHTSTVEAVGLVGSISYQRKDLDYYV